MAKDQADFTKGRMNKSADERLLPAGEYIDAQNVRLGSTELSEVGAVENTKGNVRLTELKYSNVALSNDAVCIGALDDGSEETMYWFVHDPANPVTGGVVDMIVSFNTQTQQLTYHVVTTALLNFNPTYLINGVNLIDDLLFFTDNYNAPRKINVTRGYPPPTVLHVDQISEIDISVIKPQPKESPVLTLQANIANDNFIEDAFVCFAYRYKYKDGEYSATSQFSDPAFYPSDFSLERRSYMNAGMINSINSVDVSFNTGNSNVIGIDVVFKEMDSNVIWVAKKLNKALLGYQDNSTNSITFSNGDIYTILNQSEILRAYDNVPRLAKAQTIMGNRLMYGNYLEGYNMEDEFGQAIDLTYVVEQASETESAFLKDEDRSCVGCLLPINYTYTGASGAPSDPFIIRNNEILIDLSDIDIEDLIDGAELSVSLEYRAGEVFTSNPASFQSINFFYYPFIGSQSEVLPEDRPTTTAQFIYHVEGNHTDYLSAFSGQTWNDQIGTSGNYQQSPSQYTSGYTLTDNYNGSWLTPPPPINGNYAPLTLVRSAWESAVQTDPLRIYVDGDHLHVSINGFQYTQGGPVNIYMVPELVSVRVTFNRAGNRKSLHSNRDYQVGIVYQDPEGRQTTALESINNSFHVSAYDSENINWAKVTIPSSMRPPHWADRYKFVMKQTETDYETIFITTYFKEVTGINATDPKTGRAWLRLEGENADKVKAGQELYIKVDSSGAVNSATKTTVLEVKSMAEGDIYTSPTPTPAGVYMKILPNNFTLEYASVGTELTNGSQRTITAASGSAVVGNQYPATLAYRLHDASGPWPIPAGSTVKIKTHIHRREYDRIEQDKCGRETCNFEYEGTATVYYNNLRDFFLGEGVNIAGGSECGPWGFDDDSGPNANVFYPIVYNYDSPNTTRWTADENAVRGFGPNANDENHFQFTENTLTNEFWLEIQSGTHKCWGAGALDRSSKIECEISVFPANAELVFETIPASTTGEIYYENGESFPIVAGNHVSGSKAGDVNQVVGVTDGVVNLGFFNCYSFFNGVESYKVRDSVSGKKIYLGNRVTAVSDQDYKEIRRNSSITYSGVYNQQNNINRLNEFNLGQANYKDCEDSYGPIQVLHGRRTNLLVLQEDKISYVGVGESLLTDAVGGGILTSVPDVLGKQVAKTEEYGISENPESFCYYGGNTYFTDAKRSAVIQLKGGDGADSVNVVSNNGMRSWFRDLFQSSFEYQKLGGYDPYMNEYVLSPNTNRLPFTVPMYGCGGGERVFTGLLNEYSFIIDAGSGYGNMTIDYETSNSFTVTATYNGTVFPATSTGPSTYEITFEKNIPSIETVLITITPTVPSGDSVISINIGCPVADVIRIIPIMVTSAIDAGKLIHNSFNYVDNAVSPPYTSGFQAGQYQFISPNQMQYVSANVVSYFGPTYIGQQGSGSVPVDGSAVVMRSLKLYNDTFDFDVNKHHFRYLRTATPYTNNAADIATLLAIPPVVNGGSGGLFYGSFPMPAGNDWDYLYLIWDYRESSELKLCFSSTPSISEACCECFSSPNCAPFLGTTVEVSDTAACALSPTTTYYTSTITVLGIANTEPVLGTTVYSYLGCSSGNTMGAGVIKLTDNTWVELDANGVVILTGSC